MKQVLKDVKTKVGDLDTKSIPPLFGRWQWIARDDSSRPSHSRAWIRH